MWKLRVADQYAGKQARCPACQAVALVPEVGFEFVQEPTRPAVARRSRREEEHEDDEDDRPRRRRPQREEYDEDEEERRPRRRRLPDDGSPRRRKRNETEVDNKPRSLEGNIINGGVLGGIAAMVIAVVWFVAGLLLGDFLFYYPPILFVVGLIGLIKGLLPSNEEE